MSDARQAAIATGLSQIDGTTILVSGSSGGIGEDLVRHGLELGARHIVRVDKIPPTGPTPSSNEVSDVVGDVTSEATIRKVARLLDDLGGRLDILVNAAGVFVGDEAASLDWELASARLWMSNVYGSLLLSRAALPYLAKGSHPLVVNIGSSDAVGTSAGRNTVLGISHDGLYSGSKAALIALSRSLAMAWANQGIRVNVVSPALVKTPMTADVLSPALESEARQVIPLGRLLSPRDVSTAVLGLYPMTMVTGHNLLVDGGLTCT